MTRRLIAATVIAAWSAIGSLLAVAARAWVSGIAWLLLWALLVGGPIVAVLAARRSRPSA